MPKLAVAFIGTNKYLDFLPSWHESCEKYLAPGCEKRYLVFTDGELEGIPDNIIPYYQEHLPWPYITLYRFATLLRASEEIQKYDYFLFLDADMILVDEVKPEDIFTDKSFMGVHHPCHFLGMNPHTQYPGAFETNPKSRAAITEDDDISTYWQGCLWGGKVPEVIGMMAELDRRTKDDETRDTIAVWHDESQMNKFFVENKDDVHTLGPQFAFPECFKAFCKFDPVIVHRAKDNSKYQV